MRRWWVFVLALGACGDDAGPGAFVTGGEAGPRDAATEAGPRDAGPRGPLDAARGEPTDAAPPSPPPKMDAGRPKRCRDLDCSKLDDDCVRGVCDPDTVKCVAMPRADETACGSATSNACTKPDTCVKGICKRRDRPKGTHCGDENIVCHFDDECDGKGTCVEGGVWDEFTPCGDATETECDKPDSCDHVGRCVPRHAGVDEPCGDQGILCRWDDGCDGMGKCKDSGYWDEHASCAVGPEPPPAECHPAAYECNSTGTCVSMDPPNGEPCGNQVPTGECDGPNQCLDGYCSENSFGYGTPCGDAGETTCDLHDVCNGAGTCIDNVAPYGTLCGSPPGECYAEPLCDGFGACGAAQPIPYAADYACGGLGSGCLCDGAGVCEDRTGPAPCL